MKWMKKLTAALLLGVLAVTLTACDLGSTIPTKPAEESTEETRAPKLIISSEKESISLISGQTEKLGYTLSGKNADKAEAVSFSSQNSAVAAVDAEGNLTAKAAGKTQVLAACGTASFTWDVTVYEAPGLKGGGDVAMKTGETAQLECLVVGGVPGESYPVSYVSTDPAVAEVDAKGQVTAKAAGKITVMGICRNATCQWNVTVYAPLSIRTEGTALELTVGDTAWLTYSLEGGTPDEDRTISLVSSDANIAAVDAYGQVTGAAAGTAKITLTCGAVSAEWDVTVKNPPCPFPDGDYKDGIYVDGKFRYEELYGHVCDWANPEKLIFTEHELIIPNDYYVIDAEGKDINIGNQTYRIAADCAVEDYAGPTNEEYAGYKNTYAEWFAHPEDHYSHRDADGSQSCSVLAMGSLRITNGEISHVVILGVN